MTRRIAAILAFLLLAFTAAGAASDTPPRTALFVPETAPSIALRATPSPPSFIGPAVVRDANGRLIPRAQARPAAAAGRSPRLPVGNVVVGDHYVMDGSETSVAIQPSDPAILVVGYNEGWDFDPDIPVSNSTTGNETWTARVFPNGEGAFQGFPFNPWCLAGNTSGEFFAMLLRHDLYPYDNAHVLISRSTDNGQTLTKFHEVSKTVYQDRAMFDIDRPASLGGTTGAHDGKTYLCYDDYGLSGSGYVGSFFRVLSSSGALLSETTLSGTGAVPFRGNQFQPLSGLVDGSIYLMSSAVSGGGATAIAYFHEMTNAGGGTTTYFKSTLSWAPAGQQLGTSQRWGVNGGRIDNHGVLAMDRTNGPRRGRLFFISNRNPNPSDPTHDQGDIYLSASTTGGASWSTAIVPSSTGRTQFFPMIDVDGQGWIHVAYYENGAGTADNGALNAGTANVIYTVSRDGGHSWTPSLQVNEPANQLVLDDPPRDLGASEYYLLGDYMQLRAFGTGAATSAYVLWTGYDRRRRDENMGSKRERVMATIVGAPPVPGTSPSRAALLALVLAGLGAAALFSQRRRLVPERSRTEI